ncbi:hypothetical protein ACWGJT_12050 [Streptomyces xantholiticus]
MPRLSCVFCVLAGFSVLVRAVRLCWALGLPLPEKYSDLEARISHRFKEQYSLADVVAETVRIEAQRAYLPGAPATRPVTSSARPRPPTTSTAWPWLPEPVPDGVGGRGGVTAM